MQCLIEGGDMKKIILLLCLLISNLVYGKQPIHKDISLKYIGVKRTKFNKEDIDELKKGVLKFKKGKDSIKVVLEIPEKKKSVIKNLDINSQIIAVFFHEMTGDGLREIFILTKLKEDYKIYVFSYDMGHYTRSGFVEKEYLEKIINNKFKDEKKLTVSKIKKQLKMITPQYFANLTEWDMVNYYYNIDDIIFGREVYYYKDFHSPVTDKNLADYYIKKLNKNTFAKFKRENNQFKLRIIFQGDIEGASIYNDGFYQFRDDENKSDGYYLKDMMHGKWRENKKGLISEGVYKNGRKVGKWLMFDGKYKHFGEE